MASNKPQTANPQSIAGKLSQVNGQTPISVPVSNPPGSSGSTTPPITIKKG